MIFVVGTAISSFLISRLDDFKIFDDLEKLEKKLTTFEGEKEVELADLINQPLQTQEEKSEKEKDDEKKDKIPTIKETLEGLWRVQMHPKIQKLTPYMFTNGYLEGLVQIFAYKHMANLLIRTNSDITLLQININISIAFIFCASSAVLSGYWFQSYFKSADEKALFKILFYMLLIGFVTVNLNGFLIPKVQVVIGYIIILIVSITSSSHL